jgi:hypothetical protein
MARASLITDAVQAAIGSEVTGLPELVEMKAIRDYARAVAWPDPPEASYVNIESNEGRPGGLIAPWSFFLTLGRHGLALPLPLPPPRVSMNGGNDYEYFHPIRLGDRITTRSRLVGVSERQGRMGPLIIVVTEKTLTNQRGEVVGVFKSTSLRQY